MGILDNFDGKDALLAANLTTNLQQGSTILQALNALSAKVDALQQKHDSLDDVYADSLDSLSNDSEYGEVARVVNTK